MAARRGISALFAHPATRWTARFAATGAVFGVGIMTGHYYAGRHHANKRDMDLSTVPAARAVETAEWFNGVIAASWPNMAKYIAENMRKTMEPELQKAVPAFLKSIHFTNIDIGSKPPRFHNMRIYSSSEDHIELHMDVVYEGDSHISLGVHRMAEFGISHLKVVGTMGVVMKPMMPQPPIVAGMQVFFLSRPRIELTFTGLANIAEFPPHMSDTLTDTLKNCFAESAVLPNRILMPLVPFDAVDLTPMTKPQVEGVLRVNLVSASNLKAGDVSLLHGQTSDPYVVADVGAQRWRTATVPHTLNPAWRSTRDFIVSNYSQELLLRIFDEDTLGPDDFLGFVRVPVEKLVGVTEEDSTLSDLRLPVQGEGMRGNIHFRTEWLRPVPATDLADGKAPQPKAHVASVLLHSASVKGGWFGSSTTVVDPFVRVTVDKSPSPAFKTGTGHAETGFHEWEEAFPVLVKPNQQLRFDVVSLDAKGAEQILGTATLDLSACTPGKLVPHTLTLAGGRLTNLNVSVELTALA